MINIYIIKRHCEKNLMITKILFVWKCADSILPRIHIICYLSNLSNPFPRNMLRVKINDGLSYVFKVIKEDEWNIFAPIMSMLWWHNFMEWIGYFDVTAKADSQIRAYKHITKVLKWCTIIVSR